MVSFLTPSLVLLCCCLYQCQAYGREDVHVYVSRLRPTTTSTRTYIYSLSPDNNYHSDWVPINGMNAYPGDVSYFRARDRPIEVEDSREWYEKMGDTIRDFFGSSEEEDSDVLFNKKMYVCDSNQQVRGLSYSVRILQDQPCDNSRDEEFSFYTSARELRETTKLYYGTCAISVGNNNNNNNNNGRNNRNSNRAGGRNRDVILYSRVSTQPDVCVEDNHEQRSRGYFYVYDTVLQCAPAREPANGHISNRGFSMGILNSITFQCNLGHTMVGQNTIECGWNGRWRGETPTCDKIECERPRGIANGQLVGNSYYYRDFVGYECDRGYELYPVDARIQCLDDGQWSDAAAECRRRSCGFPGVIDNGDVQGTGYEYKDKVTFTCDHGYHLVGATRAKCQSNGMWSERVPYCERIMCPRLPQLSNGFRTETDGAVGSEVLYQCDQGYNMMGSPALSCVQRGSEGVWSQQPPTCSRITCEDPEAPDHGSIVSSDLGYGQEIVFVCDEGYTLQGSDRATCGRAGWDSQPPTCNVVHCSPPRQPENGAIQQEQDTVALTWQYNDLARYTCNTGYVLQGSAVLRCGANGRWSSEPPTCDPVPCPPIGTPLNGAKDGDEAVFGAEVTFTCFPGFELSGSETSVCQEDGTWTEVQPVCNACPVGSYKDSGANVACTQCPQLSTTTSVGSTSPLHCLCEDGARKNQDGQCQAIECDALTAPAHGTMTECGHQGGAECVFSCDAGHMLRGSSVRRCTAAGWTGLPAQCQECPSDTYQEAGGSGSCLPCPRHTSTAGNPGPATATTDCHCKQGYVGPSGGPCEDVDECAQSNGGCNQTCTNIAGGHICACNIPGYQLAEDGRSCNLVQTCPALESNPGHGYLQCTNTMEYNSAICHIKCHPGYFFVSGINNYVTCGPDTSYEWSHRMVNRTARIAQCTREFFVDVQLPMSMSYKSSVHCNSMPMLIASVPGQIAEAVEGLSVCEQHCQFKDFNYSCAEISGATPESLEQSTLDVTFAVLIKNPHENAISPDCDPVCKRRNMREMLSKAFAVKNAVEALVKQSSEELELTDLPNTEVQTSSYAFSRPQILCEEGRVLTKNRLCVPCDAGYYIPSRELDTCLPCPLGTYQDKQGQTGCKSCLEGSTTLTVGSDHPVMCNARVTEINVNTTAQVEGFNQYAGEEEVSEDEADGILEAVL